MLPCDQFRPRLARLLTAFRGTGMMRGPTSAPALVSLPVLEGSPTWKRACAGGGGRRRRIGRVLEGPRAPPPAPLSCQDQEWRCSGCGPPASHTPGGNAPPLDEQLGEPSPCGVPPGPAPASCGHSPACHHTTREKRSMLQLTAHPRSLDKEQWV